MASMSYYEGETKKRPGVYKRQSNASGINVVGAVNGIGAIAIDADWGPLNEVRSFSGTNAESKIRETYGETKGVLSALAFLSGGLSTLYICRVGEGGTCGSVTLDEAVTITLLYPGTRAFTVTVRDSIANTGYKEMLLLEGSVVKQSITFQATAKDLADAVTASKSVYISAAVLEGKDSTAMTNTSQTAITPGTAPTVNTASYSKSFNALEPYPYNVITLDTHDTDVQALLANYAARADESGKRLIAALGGYTDLAFDTRCNAAKSYNSENIVYLGSGYIDSASEAVGRTENDTRANAIMAGYIASVPANSSVVHQTIQGAADLIEKLTNADYEKAIDSGMILLSMGSDGQVWFDSGVNTLVTPDDTQDEGWKKIKRVKIRYELFDRIDRTLEPLVGRVNATTDGFGAVIQAAQKVIDTMVAEGKLIEGTFTLVDSSPDSGWFEIAVTDTDTLEKIYLHYKFRYSQSSETE